MGSVLGTTTTTTLFIYLYIVIYHTVTMFSTCAITLSLLLSVVNCLEDVSIYEDEASDPRLFFANYTSGLLAVNTTILAYAGIIVAAGVVVGLVLYFIATNPQQRYYGSNSYNSNYYSQSRMLHDASSFLGDFDLLGLVTKGVEIYKKLNEEEE